MKLPFDLLSQNYIKPKLYLCETNKERICELETIELKGTFKFNAYSELTFTVARTYTNMTTGETQVNPFYDRIEALRLILLDGFGYFEIQDPEITSDGIREVKNITAYGLEYSLSQKYLEDFKINTGEVDSLEVINAKDENNIIPISLYNEGNPELSLLDLCMEKIYGWKVGHVDSSLKTMGRTFDVSRESVYDFIVQDICEKFNCFAIFDTLNNTINLYAESLITKFIGDGTTKTFTIASKYGTLGYVSIDSYKTTAYTYNPSTGVLTFEEAPASGARIEVTDGSQEQWTTDVYVSFDNLAQEVNVSYSADDIKTVLTVKGADDLDIREVNMGLPYIVDLSYYYSVDWMGQDLYDAYTRYLQKYDDGEDEYRENSIKMIDLNGHLTYEKNRLSLQYSIADNVTSETTGTYYVRGGTAPDYYYTEVKLPTEYNANVEHYYMLSGSDLDETKFSKFYEALKKYFISQDDKDTSEIEELKDSFVFVEKYTIDNLVTDLKAASSTSAKDTAIKKFLDEVFDQLGLTPLKTLYYEPYKKIKETNEEAGWNDTSNANYWSYYPVTIIMSALDKEIADREQTINEYQQQYDAVANRNQEIAEAALIYNNFTKEQLIRLSPFLREDEYTDDTFVITDIDGTDNIMQMKKELRECGRIELAKLCEPKLEFSMNMANIYALPEFEPIIHQFQLGNLINVVIRPDYIKRARLLEVDINFDDFSDFSCAFGELTNLKTPSSIHADLLASAISAGKSVASSASYWNKGSEAVTSLSLQIQQGLLDANTVIKAIDGNQNCSIDAYGIHLRKVDPDTGVVDPKEGWIVNNQFLYSDDNFKTSTKSVFGEYQIGDQIKWGLLAEAVMAGYLAGCTIKGGTIDIGEGTFVVDESGNVTMNAATIKGYAKNDNLISSINASPEEVAIDSSKISLSGALTHTRGDYKVTLRGVQSDVGKGVFYITDSSSGSATYPVRINGDGSASFTNVSISGSSTIAAACIPNLSASKITSGTIDTDRLSSSVITTSNFSSKSLSTGNLSIKEGCVIGTSGTNGCATIQAYSGLTGLMVQATSSTSYGATLLNIVKCTQDWVSSNSSNEEIKSEVHGFDDRYDIFYNKLNPQLFKYNDALDKGYTMGYIWQEVDNAISEAGLTRNDVGAVYEDEFLNGGLGLRKIDFIALNTWQIQKLKARVEELEAKLSALEA